MGAREVIARRRRERATLLARAEQFARGLAHLAPTAVVVFGSVARGDFNRWSDIDVLVVADVEGGFLARQDLLGDRPALVQPFVWTPAEWHDQLARRNPIAVEAVERGIWLRGSAEALAAAG